MNNTSDPYNNSQNLPSSSISINEVFVELRGLLAIPLIQRAKEWQESVSLLISAIGKDFPKQENSEIALVDISLIALAAQNGSKEAKKRALKPTRWISIAPPSISIIFNDIDEARAAVRVLHPLRTDWVEDYVCRELAINKWEELTPIFVDWLLKVTPSVEAFLRKLNMITLESSSDYETWIANVFDNATKSLAKSHIPAGLGMMSEISEFASRFNSNDSVNLAKNTRNEIQKTRDALLALISQVSSLEPSVLVQGAIISAINSLCPSSVEKNNFSKQKLEILCRRTISLLSSVVPFADQAYQAHYREIWSTYRQKLPNAEHILKNSLRETPSLNILESKLDEQKVNQELGVTAGLERVICELIVNWDDYYALHLIDPAAKQLTSRIHELCIELGITKFGEIDQTVAFDPVQHFLSDKLTTHPNKVRIVRPGIALKRIDGTSRVLLLAAVTTATPKI